MLGVGLAMDAFSVSLANGLNEPQMKRGKTLFVASIFALFQFLMPVIGWVCVHTILQYFTSFERAIPWIALVLLCFIGGKMIFDSFGGEEQKPSVGILAILVQGIATSIDALSVGFTIAGYPFWHAFLACAIIGVLTFAICLFGIFLGKNFGTKLSNKATLIGGIILILIGVEIFLTGIL